MLIQYMIELTWFSLDEVALLVTYETANVQK